MLRGSRSFRESAISEKILQGISLIEASQSNSHTNKGEQSCDCSPFNDI